MIPKRAPQIHLAIIPENIHLPGGEDTVHQENEG